MWESVELALAVACVTVFVAAGALKLLRSERFSDRLLGAGEIIVAAVVAVPATRPGGLLAAMLAGVGFTAYAVASADRPCRCFGDRFRATSRRARVLRALGVVAIAIGGLGAWLATRGSAAGTDWRLTAIVIGLAAGAAVVVLPSLSFTPRTRSVPQSSFR